jgi:3-deoxy-D-manno-octulosonate 8-phosphate phosphatase (KDO 8-P phosphatase)
VRKEPVLFDSISELILKDISIVISDFDGVFTDNSVWVDENGIEQVKCSRFDGIGISKLKAVGVELVVVSTEPNNVVLKRCEKLKVESYNNVDDKGKFVKGLLQSKGLKRENALFIGNDENDIPALEYVRFGVGVADSYETFLYSAQYVLCKNGGDGAIRALCEIIAKKRMS